MPGEPGDEWGNGRKDGTVLKTGEERVERRRWKTHSVYSCRVVLSIFRRLVRRLWREGASAGRGRRVDKLRDDGCSRAPGRALFGMAKGRPLERRGRRDRNSSYQLFGHSGAPRNFVRGLRPEIESVARVLPTKAMDARDGKRGHGGRVVTVANELLTIAPTKKARSDFEHFKVLETQQHARVCSNGPTCARGNPICGRSRWARCLCQLYPSFDVGPDGFSIAVAHFYSLRLSPSVRIKVTGAH